MTSSDRQHPLGSRLLGSPTESVAVQRVRVQLLLTCSILGANVVGVVVVLLLIAVVIPGDPVFVGSLATIDAVVIPVYVVAAMLIGVVGGTRLARRDLRWALDSQPPTAHDLRATLAVPRTLTLLQAGLWGLALVVFTVLYSALDPQNAARVAFPIAFGGVVVGANSYLLGEFALRPIAARALVAGPAPRRHAIGVRGRTVLAWALGSGVPVAGLMTVAIFALQRKNVSPARLDVTILALGGVTLVVGLLLTVLTTNAVVAPLRGVRAGLMEVGRGRLDARVVVFDGSELGELQAGFNTMAAGLAEREQLRDLFGRQVGRDVAEAALATPPELGGEERDVAVFFIDLVGSTTLAETRPPAEVVALLNRFFSVIVDEVERYGGIINKFQGDGALAVFGAPLPQPDAAGQSLAAARTISERLARELPECRSGTGVAAGRAVAGNVGDERRFEYTVIGDPVNQAARLAELAKSQPGGLLASIETLAGVDPAEAARWCAAGETVLRGRTATTSLVAPVVTPG